MNKIKIMTAEEFADYILSQKEGDAIEFAISKENFCESDPINLDDVSDWFFAKIITIPEYFSRFLLIDFCGGREAIVYPLSNMISSPDWKDVDFDVEDFNAWIKQWMSEFCEERHGICPDQNDYGQYIVYVEIK